MVPCVDTLGSTERVTGTNKRKERNMTPMQRYEWATSDEGWLTVAGWEALAADLDGAASHCEAGMGEGYVSLYYRDRSHDCRNRAQRLRAA